MNDAYCGWQLSFLRVKVTCDDLVSFTFIFHFFIQFSRVLRCSWRLREAAMRSAWVANIAVSPANVPIVVCLNVGRSDVYRM